MFYSYLDFHIEILYLYFNIKSSSLSELFVEQSHFKVCGLLLFINPLTVIFVFFSLTRSPRMSFLNQNESCV